MLLLTPLFKDKILPILEYLDDGHGKFTSGLQVEIVMFCHNDLGKCAHDIDLVLRYFERVSLQHTYHFLHKFIKVFVYVFYYC